MATLAMFSFSGETPRGTSSCAMAVPAMPLHRRANVEGQPARAPFVNPGLQYYSFHIYLPSHPFHIYLPFYLHLYLVIFIWRSGR
jgi:hypothetical protein